MKIVARIKELSSEFCTCLRAVKGHHYYHYRHYIFLIVITNVIIINTIVVFIIHIIIIFMMIKRNLLLDELRRLSGITISIIIITTIIKYHYHPYQLQTNVSFLSIPSNKVIYWDAFLKLQVSSL